MAGMVFRPVWPPTEREMAKFLFGLPPPREWSLTYRRGALAWGRPLTALVWMVLWCGKSHYAPAWGYSVEESWTVIWTLRDCGVHPVNTGSVVDFVSDGRGLGARVELLDDGTQAPPREIDDDE